MNNDRLYIDDVLVDLGENVEITLVINSNLFRDISKITGNTTYTIRLPRTANNAAVFGVAGDVRSDDTFPTSYHKADYIRGGVPVITGGRAVLLSVSDMYEISISWGAFAPLADVVNKGLTLPQLTGNETIYFGYQNFATNYDNAMLTGYYYATYDPFINETSTEWVSADEPMWNQGQEAITFQSGAVLTGAVGETISLTPIARAGSQCAVVSFMAGMYVNLSGITGAADAAAWCVVDKANNVIIKSEELTAITEGFIAPVNALRLIINTTSGGSGLLQYLALPTSEGDLRLDYINKFSRLPVVNVSWILARIEQDTGVTFDFPPTAKAYIDTLAIPLVTAKANALTMGGVAVMTFNTTSNLGALSLQAVANNIFDEQSGQVFQLTASREAKITIDTQGWFLFNVSSAVPIEDGTMEYDGVTVNTKTYGFFPTYIEIKVEHTDPQAEDDIYIVGTEDFNNFPTQSDWQSDNGVDFQRLIYGYGEINIVSGDEITFTLKNRIGKYRGFLFAGGRLIVSEKVDGDVPRGAQFPIIANLPDIKVTDFVQFLCAITGTIPLNLQSTGNVFFNDVSAIDTATAYDWTTKVIPSHDNVEQAREISYRINEYARKNWYRWKEDSTTLNNYDAYMEINDDTLESEHDVITFPFAASDGNRVPIFEADNNGGTGYGVRQEVYKLKPCEPRIMSVYRAANDTAALRFDIDMQNVIDTKMTGMAASLADVRVIKERIRMSDVELAAFNESVPVYLRQYGSYFAVLTLESSGDGTAIATMLRLRKSLAQPVPPEPPYDYEVDYLESDGLAFIDTGIKASSNVEIQMYLADFFDEQNKNKGAFGGRNGSGSSEFGMMLDNSGNVIIGNGSQITLSPYTNYSLRCHVEIGGGVWKIGAATGTYTPSTYESNYNVYLFAMNNSGGAVKGKCKIGATHITDGVTTLDLIPVIKNGEGFMYDQISGQLFGNVGTGAFSWGNYPYDELLTQLTIVNTETPAIITDYYPNEKSKFVFSCKISERPSTAANKCMYGTFTYINNTLYRRADFQFRNNYHIQAKYGDGAGGLAEVSSYSLNTQYYFEVWNNTIKMNGNTYSNTIQSAFTADYPLVLFSNCLNGTPTIVGTPAGGFVGVIYGSFDIYENNILIRSYYPAKKNGRVGLWERITNQMLFSTYGEFSE